MICLVAQPVALLTAQASHGKISANPIRISTAQAAGSMYFHHGGSAMNVGRSCPRDE